MRLNDNEVLLFPFSEKELTDSYISWLNDDEVCRYNPHGEDLYTREKALKFLKSLESDEYKRVYAVYTKLERIHIGNISLQRIDRKNGSAEVALLFGEKKFWGNGFATNALKQLVSFADDMKLHRLYLGTHINDLAMQRVAAKCGFLKEGVLKEAQFKNGKYNDVIIFGLLLKRCDYHEIL